jgi:endonuclease/exonuclease/phosphatase family metal-dependent hydrolase
MRPLVLILMLAACSPFPDGFGDDAKDLALLEDVPSLQHLAAALDDAAELDVSSLVSGSMDYTSAPDPSDWIQQTYDDHQALPPLAEGAVPLRVLTYNVGLLSRKYLGATVEVPRITERRERFAEELLTADYDVLLLQEIWENEDVDRLRAAAETHGYLVYAGTDDLHPEHGLAIAIRESLVEADEGQTETQFHAQRKLEFSPGPNIKRGWLTWSFQLAGTSQTVHLYNLHATSFVQFWQKRDLQAREVGLEVAAHPDTDVVILGGDLNSGPFYVDDVWVNGEGKDVPEWWRNATSWALWQHYGEMYDVHGAAAPLQDVVDGQAIPSDWEGYLSEPYGDDTFCDTATARFTGTDCNSLYFDQYAGTEYPARLDHLMVRDPSQHVRVDGSELTFVEPLDFGGESFELSDHYGVAADLRIGEVP